MYFDFGPKNSTLLIFFIHGLVFTTLLLINGVRSSHKSNFWLAAFVFLSTLYIAPFMLGYAGWYTRQPYRDLLFYVPFQQLFLIPPILYFYVKSLLNPSMIFKKKDLIHFVPAILYFIYSVIIWVTDKIVLNEYYFYLDQRDKDLDTWYQVAGFIFMVVYLFKCINIYNQYRNNTYETVSFADSILYSWIQRFLFAFLLLLLIRVLFFIINPEWANFGSKFWYYMSYSLLFYYISISGYVHSARMDLSIRPVLNYSQPLDQLFWIEEIEKKSPRPVSQKEITNKAFDPDLKTKIEEVMTSDKVFRNPELTLFDMAKLLDTNPKKVSNTINKGFKMNFNDFVNSYRTREVISTIESKEDNVKTLVGIAYDSGFNSKSTFNRAFKKYTGLTPKEYFQKRPKISAKS